MLNTTIMQFMSDSFKRHNEILTPVNDEIVKSFFAGECTYKEGYLYRTDYIIFDDDIFEDEEINEFWDGEKWEDIRNTYDFLLKNGYFYYRGILIEELEDNYGLNVTIAGNIFYFDLLSDAEKFVDEYIEELRREEIYDEELYI